MLDKRVLYQNEVWYLKSIENGVATITRDHGKFRAQISESALVSFGPILIDYLKNITKSELSECLYDAYYNEHFEEVDLSDLGFYQFNCNVNISSMRVKGNLNQSNQKVDGRLNQDRQKVGVHLSQAWCKVGGNISQSGHISGGEITQGNQRAKSNIDQLDQISEIGVIYQGVVPHEYNNGVTPILSGEFESISNIIKEYKLKRDDLQYATILVGTYDLGSYWGESFVLFKFNNKLYEINASHCSCYGLEGQWEPEEVTLEELKHRADKGNIDYLAELKQAVAKLENGEF